MSTSQPRSLAAMFLERVAKTPDRMSLMYPTNPGWKSLTWREVGDRVRAIASGLRALGVQDEQRCAILSSTRYEWVLMDLGIMCAAGATTTIYPSNTPDECAYILKDSASRVVFVEDTGQQAKVARHRADLPDLMHVVLVDGQPANDGGWTISLDQLMERGRTYATANPGAFESTVGRIGPDWLATLMYTSGTTGQPKGVELIHDCWVYEATAIDEMRLLTEDDLQYLWLPLSHSFGKVLESAQMYIGFPTAVDGRIDKMVDNLGEVKPTFVAAVPRVFEKVHNKVVVQAQEHGGLKLKIFEWAFEVGRQVSALIQQGQKPSGMLAVKHAIAHKLVFSKLHARFGGRLRFFISGASALSKEVAEWFHAAGILVAEGYGLTETSAASFVNRPNNFKLGTVGPPLPGTQVKIAPEDGEILIKGRGVMRGYHGLPEATREALTPDGWMCTGDIGFVDADGFLKITDRKKDLIKTSGGKYVAPQALESKMKAICPYVNMVLVHGNDRNFCSALFTIDEDSCRNWLKEHGGGHDRPSAEIVKDARLVGLVQGFVDQLNSQLASYETIKKFALLAKDFTVEDGDLTPSLKVKRKVVEGKYRQILDGFYAGAGRE